MNSSPVPTSSDYEARLPVGLARFLVPGCRIWPVDSDEFGREGHMVVWPEEGRAGVHWGNEVLFGHWDDKREVILLDADEFLEVAADGRIIETHAAA